MHPCEEFCRARALELHFVKQPIELFDHVIRPSISIQLTYDKKYLPSTRDPAWLSGKVFDLLSMSPWFDQHWIFWVFRMSVLGQDNPQPQPSTNKNTRKTSITCM